MSQEKAGHTQTPPTGGQGYMVGGAWQGQGEGARAQVPWRFQGPSLPSGLSFPICKTRLLFLPRGNHSVLQLWATIWGGGTPGR